MADRISQVDYYYFKSPDKPGSGAKVLGAFRKERVGFLAVHAFPEGKSTQVDVVPRDNGKFLRAARKHKLRVSKKKRAFLIQGNDRVGALSGVFEALGEAGINVTAMTGLCGGKGRFGAILWVRPRDHARAAKLLGARR